MRITIFDKQDKKAYTLPANTGSTYQWKLMEEEYILVNFHSSNVLKFRKGYWCNIEGLGRFEIVDKPKPEAMTGEDGYDYQLRMDRPWYRFKNRIYFYSRSQTNGMEVNWSLTDTLEHHAALLVQSLNDIGFKYDGERYEVAIAQTISREESRLVQFNKTSILDAITAIAEAFECEWWIDENVIHFGRCEQGEAVTLEVGKEIQRPLVRQDDSTEKHGTRLYAFGSSRNLNTNYRRELANPFAITGQALIYQNKVRFTTSKPNGKWYSDTLTLKFTAGTYTGRTVPFTLVSGTYSETGWDNPVFEIELGYRKGDNGLGSGMQVQFITDSETATDGAAVVTSWSRESFHAFCFTTLTLPKLAVTGRTTILPTNGTQAKLEYVGTLYDESDEAINDGKEMFKRADGMSLQGYATATLRNVALGYVSRLYTRPIDGDSDIAIQGIAQTTLKMPIGTPYIDSEPNLPDDDITEVVRQYEDIYPRCLLTITEVTEVDATDTDEDTGNVTHWTAYRFKAKKQDGTAYEFDQSYILPDESKPLSIHFESGRLNGMDFEVAFNPETTQGDTRTFEIVRNETYTLQLPNETAKPQVGDTLYMYNMDVTFIDDSLIAAAENELKEKAEADMTELRKDDGTYTANTNAELCERKKINLTYGNMVTLVAPEFFEEKEGHSRTTRVIGWSKNIDDPYTAEYTIGEASAYSPYGALANDIEEVIYLNAQNEILAGGGSGNSKRTQKQLSEKLSRVSDDTALGHITFNKGLTSKEIAKLLKGAYFGAFVEGLRGGFIDGSGNAELNELVTRAKALLQQLEVKGTAQFDGNLFSSDFISGFLTGKGWGITKESVQNALGVEETKYTGEFDNIVVRGALRVFTFVVSQMLGENDNRIFTAMLEVDHYDSATGKVWLDTKNGKLYNPFRKGDYIMVQQYNGMPSEENQYYITKHYELIITDAGMGSLSDGENRLDWVTFKSFVSANEDSATNLITKGDTFCRVDSETDADRKGIIQVMTVGSATPYIDIAYGLKTDPDTALKGRIGNLTGINSPLFGQLEGFGELLINLYAVGDFRLRRTGESLDAKIEMLHGLFSTRYQKQTYEMTEDENYLTNATFTENMDRWVKDADEDTKLLTYSDNTPIVLNGAVVSTGYHRANVEQYEGAQMLHLQATGLTQRNALIRKPETHKEYDAPAGEDTTSNAKDVQDTLYLTVKLLPKTAGQLTIGFKYDGKTPEGKTNTLPYTDKKEIAKSNDWQILQWEGTWHGLGDFRIHYTGETYIALLSVTDRPLQDFKKTVSTQIIQTAENIRLLGQKNDATNQRIVNLGIELMAEDEQIRLYIDTTTSDVECRLGILIDNGDAAVKLYAEEYVKGAITDNNKNYYTISEIEVKVGEINQYVIDVRDELTQKYNGEIATINAQIVAANAAITKAQNDTTALRTYLDGAFSDGIVDEAEKIAIEKWLKTIAGTKKEIDSTYTDLINNAYLDTTSSEYTNLANAKRNVDNTYYALYTAIDNTIADGKATQTEINNVNTAFDNFNNAIGTFSTRVEEANEAIMNVLKKYTDDKVEAVRQAAKQMADDAAKAETYEQATNPWLKWGGGTEHEHVGALWKYTGSDNSLRVMDPTGTFFYLENGKTYRYVGYNSNYWEDVSEIAYAVSYTTQKANHISTVLANFNKDGSLSSAGGSVISAYGNKLWATTNVVDTLTGKVNACESSINQQATSISLRVQYNDVISAINQSAETVQINASKIKLEGYTSINESFIIDVDGTFRATGGKIGGWTINSNFLHANVGSASLRVGDGSNHFLNINYDSSALLNVRNDKTRYVNADYAVRIQSYGDGAKGIYIIAQAGNNTKAMEVYGNDYFKVRSSETFEIDGEGSFAPGCTIKTASFTLPTNPKKGTMFFCKGVDADITVTRSGNYVIMDADDNTTRTTMDIGMKSHIIVFDGSRWVDYYCG